MELRPHRCDPRWESETDWHQNYLHRLAEDVKFAKLPIQKAMLQYALRQMPEIEAIEKEHDMWQEIEIKGFKEFVEQIKALSPHWPNRGQWMFRGQADQDWSLEPSLLRLFKDQGLTSGKLVAIEQDMKRAFKSEAHRFLAVRENMVPPTARQATFAVGGTSAFTFH